MISIDSGVDDRHRHPLTLGDLVHPVDLQEPQIPLGLAHLVCPRHRRGGTHHQQHHRRRHHHHHPPRRSGHPQTTPIRHPHRPVVHRSIPNTFGPGSCPPHSRGGPITGSTPRRTTDGCVVVPPPPAKPALAPPERRSPSATLPTPPHA